MVDLYASSESQSLKIHWLSALQFLACIVLLYISITIQGGFIWNKIKAIKNQHHSQGKKLMLVLKLQLKHVQKSTYHLKVAGPSLTQPLKTNQEEMIEQITIRNRLANQF